MLQTSRRRPSRSVFARGIACLSVFLTVSVSCWPLIAATRASTLAPALPASSAPAPVSIASARASVVDRISPVAAVWRRQGRDLSAAVLFDGDQATSLRSEQDAVVMASLAEAQPIRGLGIFGQADGKLSAYLPDGAGMPGKPIAGLQDLDLASLPLRWNRFWSREAPVARDLVLVWRPHHPSAVLKEIEIFGLVPDRAAEAEATLADRLLAGTPAGAVESWSEMAQADVSAPAVGYDGLAAFPVHLAADPLLVDRAFLVYELSGYDRWSAPRRQINGFGVVGGYRAEPVSGAGSVQVEEISPDWLFPGDNEVHFLPVDENDPIGYRVRKLRIVTFPAVGRPSPASFVAPGAGAKRADAAASAALSDGDATTGLVPGRAPGMVTLPVPDQAQPSGLNVRVGARLTGQLDIATVAADGRVSRTQEVDAATLAPGWNFLSLDQLPRGAAVRLSWDAGRDGAGLLAEARLVTSPEPAGRGRRLVVSAPLHGECVDHEVYLRGFLTGAEGVRPQLSIVDRASGSALGEDGAGVAADGAFALSVAEPTSARGQKWALTLRARYADGDELARDLPIETCADRPAVARSTAPSGPRPLIEDEGAPYAKTVAAGQADTIEMGGVRLDIPAGALAETTRITVRPMVADDVAPLNPLMDNVTPDRQAFRMGPHNLQFKRPVRISVPYDRTLVPDGVEPNEMSVFFFDDLEGRWQSLPAAKARDGRVLVAETTHFTDFISATLASPEHPSPMSNDSKMFANLKAGDPAAGVRIMAPPTPGPDGAARMTFPIEIPPGRNGMQPNVDLQYDSNGTDGLMGVGWSFPTPNIQVDTKFGAPRVQPNWESDHYLLNGEELVKVGSCGQHLPIMGRCPSPTQFRRRAEHGGFERILRNSAYGVEHTGGIDPAWTVTNQDGTIWEYGNTPFTPDTSDDDWIDYGEGGIPVYWALANIIDGFGNRVEYHYQHTLDNLDETLSLASITYTRSPTKAPSYTIVPEYIPRAPTYSALSDAHLSKEIRTDNLLSGLRVMYAGHLFRHYLFTYAPGEFGKPLLQSVSVNSGDFDGNFYTYKFDYNKLPKDASNRVQFGSPIQWATASSSAATLGKSYSTSGNLSGFIGLGPVDCYPHVGVGMSGGANVETSREAFVDVNGDGLPDILTGSNPLSSGGNAVYLNGFAGSNRNQGSFTAMSTAYADLSHSAGSSRTLSLGLHFPGEFGANGSRSTSHSVEDLTIADMNGDGLPDLFNGVSFYCNQFPGTTCPPSSGLPFSTAPTSWNGQAALPTAPDDAPSSGGGSTFQTDMMVRWTAPFAGTVQLTAPASRQTTVLPLPAKDQPYADDATVSLYFRTKLAGAPTDILLWNYNFAPTDTQTCNPLPGNTTCNPTSTNAPFLVAAGDEFIFMVGSPEHQGQAGNIRNAINWNPRFQYISLSCPNPSDVRSCVSSFSDHTGAPIYSYNFGVDHRLAGGMAPTWTTTSADTRANGVRVATTTVRITGTIQKLGASSDDVKYQIIKLTPSGNRTVVWTQSMTAAQTGTISLDALNVTADVQGKFATNSSQSSLKVDQLVFQVVSDSPIEPTNILWRPVVTYLNYCAPDAADQQSRFLTSQPMTPNAVKINCTNTPSDVIGNGVSQAVDVQFPAFRYGPESPDAAASYPIPSPEAPQYYFAAGSGFHTIRAAGTLQVQPGPSGLDPQNPDRGQVVLLFHAGQRLLKKVVLPLGTGSLSTVAGVDTGAMSLRANEPFYATLISYGKHTVTWLGGLPLFFDGSSSPGTGIAPTLQILAEPPLPGKAAGIPYGGPLVDQMVGGFRQWTYGVHNHDYFPFSTSQIQLPPPPNNTTVNSFFPAVASTVGLGINPPDLTLPGSQGPVWRGRSSDDYIAPGTFHPGYTGSGAAGASVPPGLGLRRSVSQTFGGGINGVGTVELNSGTTKAEYDLIDMTGDRIPDMVGQNTILASGNFYDNTVGWSPASGDIALPFSTVRSTSNLNVRFGIGLGSFASQMTQTSNASGESTSLKSSVPSFGLGYGTSVTDADMMDINGDGYTDYVQKSGANLTVHLGRGRWAPGFHEPFQAWSQTWPMPAVSGNIVQSPQFTLGNVLLGDGLRVQDTASNSLEMNILGMGGGVSFTSTRTMVDMADMNGDGLPDRVMKLPGADEIQIQFNQGTKFGAPEHWAMPGWGAAGIESKGFAAVGLGSNDALAFSQTQNTSLNVGFPIFIPIIVVCLVAELSAGADASISNTQMSLQDINGDGLPDEVFKKNDLSDPNPATGTSTTVWAKLNPAGLANRLKTVTGPFGGFYDIEYARAGNQVDPNTHTDDPTNHWVMSAATIRRGSTSTGQPAWNAEPSQRTQYTYANGFYSRADRIFVGFAKVTATHVGTGDQLVEQDTYDTSDVYHKGLLLKHVVRKRASGDTTTSDDNLPVFDVVQNAYEVRPLQSVFDPVMDNRPIFFVPKIRTFFRTYEGGATNPDALTMTRELDYDYENTYGAVTNYADLGAAATTADDMKYTITPYQDTTNYIIKPGAVTARDINGTVLATRAPAYYSNGKMANLTDVIMGGRNPADGTPYTATNATWQFHYDEFGNLMDYTDPVGYSVTVTSVDPDVATYPMTFQDSFGYTWTEKHNVLTGALSQTTDVNGVTVGYVFDVHQRLINVFSPWTGTTGTSRLNVSYLSATDPLTQADLPARSLVQYQNPEQSATLSYADGWGRVFQTKHKSEVDSTGNGTAAFGVTVSGKKTYDEYGRVASEGMPQFLSGASIDLLPGFSNLASRNPTSFTYDVLSRRTRITYPGTTRPPAMNSYNLVSVGGVLRKQVVATDSNGQVVRTYRDPRNNVVLVETPNTIGGATTPTNLQTTYAFDPLDRLHIVTDAKANKTTINWDSAGRMVDMTNADTGKTFFDRDLNGNVARKQNAKSNLIVYHRTKNRLDSITYPTSATVTYNYGPPGAAGRRAGRLANRTDEAGTESYTYDDYGNVSQTQFTPAPASGAPTPPTYQTDYTYDPTTGTLRTVQVGGAPETIAYSYNAQGLVNSVNGFPTGPSPTPTHYAGKIDYDELGKRTRIELGNGVTTTYAYDSLTRRLSNLNTTTGSGAFIQKNTYGYDQVGHVTTMANTVGAPPSSTPSTTVAPGPTSYTFGYDNLYQLRTSTGAYTGVGAFGGRNYSVTMAYDEIGNITSKVQSDTLRATVGASPVTQTPTSYTFNYTYGGVHPHAAMSVGSTQSGTQTGTYDADGNRQSMKNGTIGRDLTWNEEDRMSTVKVNGVASTMTTFLYRADGTRAIKRALNDTYYVSPHFVDRRNIATTRNIMLGDDRLVSIVTTNTGQTRTFFYHPDHLQSSNYTTDTTGTLVQHDEYFPFGETWVEELRNKDQNNKTPYLFSAKEQDESGLYYFGARYLDARVSTWMNPDPALPGYVNGKPNKGLYNPANLGSYSYSYNSPVSLSDPTGLTPIVVDEVTIVGRLPSKEAKAAAAKADAKMRAFVAKNDKWVRDIAIKGQGSVLPSGASTEAFRSVGALDNAAADWLDREIDRIANPEKYMSKKEARNLNAFSQAMNLIMPWIDKGGMEQDRGMELLSSMMNDAVVMSDLREKSNALRAEAKRNIAHADELEDFNWGLTHSPVEPR